ncbi:response regulator transcription factor [Winogradskyella sp. F6397]|uniref:Response regulator transcription factor n=1 Tax=Winogradskyella marina TaxID=2785530 RepID=A0ABS0EFX1_9FLAO|nr:response regulator transcription factor [Winogradskyella marina]MBF8149350.1 response regulator transcription factor [Winogradskyella marina]
MKPTVIIADDHPLLLEGNKLFLEKNWYNVIATANDGNDAYNKIIKLQPDVAILDYDMPIIDGLEVAKTLKSKNSSTKIIILTLHKQESIIKEIGKLIDAYILKESALSELETCLKKVLNDENFVSPALEDKVYLKSGNTDISSLTKTELKILKYLASNLSSSEIAETLFISKRTVEKHRSNIISKLKLDKSQNALVIWVQKHQELFTT